MGEDLVKSRYRLASRDVSQGNVHRKFEISSLETKITHCPTRVALQLATLKKPTLPLKPGYLCAQTSGIVHLRPIKTALNVNSVTLLFRSRSLWWNF